MPEVADDLDREPTRAVGVRPAVALTVVWVMSAIWWGLAVIAHDSGWALAFSGPFLMGLLTMVSLGQWRRSKTAPPFSIRGSELTIFVAMPFVLGLVGTTTGRAPYAPIGIHWAVVGAAGANFGFAVGLSVLEWRARRAAVQQAHQPGAVR
jgi:hypothetical protein